MSDIVITPMENLPPDFTAQIVTTCQLLYRIPSLSLMIFFLFYLGRSINYTNSFYRLVQIGLIVNICCSLNSWFATRLEKHPSVVPILKFVVSIVPIAITMAKYLTYFFMHMQFLSTVAFSIHRIFTVLYPKKFEMICSRWYPAIAISFFIYSHLPKLLWPGFAFEVSIQNGSLVKTRYNLVYANAININAIFSVIYFILISTIGITTVFLVTNHLKNFNLPADKISRKLSQMAFTYCFIYTGILLWSVITSIDSNHPFLPIFIVNNNFLLLTFLSDIMTLALPYIMIIFDSNIRKDIFRRIKNKSVVSVVVTSVVVL